MNHPKVSVVVPVYNTEKYLRRCLDSLVNQTLQEVEIVAVNDGSPDKSRDILEEYKAKYPDRFQVIHKENGGQASARNLAFTVCRGEYIGFLDSDDFVRAEMFEKLYNKAVECGADYVACGYTDITYENGREIVLKEYVASRPVSKPQDMFFGALASPFLHLYKRELITDNNITFPEGVIYEDTAFYLNLIPHITRPAVIEEPLAYRLRHSNSTMTTFKKEKVANIFPVIRSSIDYYNNTGESERYGRELEYFSVRVLLCSSMQRISMVKSFRDARTLQRETLRFIKENFADYRHNPYMKGGLSNLYMRLFNGATAPLFLVLYRIANRFRRTYS